MRNRIFPSELTRFQYVVSCVAGCLILGLFCRFVRPVSVAGKASFVSAVLAAVTYIIVYACIPRMRNAGESLWYLLFLLVPPVTFLVLLYLFFAPSDNSLGAALDFSPPPIDGEDRLAAIPGPKARPQRAVFQPPRI